MKKNIKNKFGLGLILMVLVFSTLTGCGKNDVLKGKWTVVNSGLIEEREEENMVQDLYDNMYSMLFAKGTTLEFVEGSKVIINGIKVPYEFEGNKLTISDNQTDVVFDVELNDNLVLEVNKFIVILEKN